MRFWRFLKYERSYIYIYIYIISFLIVMAVLFTEPRSGWQWDSLVYALMLNLLLLAGFLIYRYMRNIQVIRFMNKEDSESLSLEAEAYRQAMEKMDDEHICALNGIQAKQNEHYNFIVSWFHENKTPISVIRLLQQTEVDAKSLVEEVSGIEHYVDQALYYAKLDSFHQDYWRRFSSPRYLFP